MRAEMIGDRSSHFTITARVMPSVPSNVVLGIHEPFLDPRTVFTVIADGLRVQQLRKGSFDLLVDLGELA